MEKLTILVIDDNPTNLEVLLEYLEESGFEVAIARSGESALLQIEHIQPDLILLDVVMPGIDGFETCRRFKEKELTREIPIIFITALSDSVDKVKGFLAGGADYITKPFQHEEVLARITAHLRIRQLEQRFQAERAMVNEQQRIITEQQKLIDQQQKSLEELHACKTTFFSFISHDLQRPLDNLLGSTRLIIENLGQLSKEQIREQMIRLQTSAERLYDKHENLITLSKFQLGTLEYAPAPIHLDEIVIYHIIRFTPYAESKKVTFSSSLQENMIAYADDTMVGMVIRNILANAVEFTGIGGGVNITIIQNKEMLEISVTDSGIGMRAEILHQAFQFKTTVRNSSNGHDPKTGLGLVLCKHLVEKNGGKIWLESQPGEGTICSFTLPRHGNK